MPDTDLNEEPVAPDEFPDDDAEQTVIADDPTLRYDLDDQPAQIPAVTQ